VVAAQQLDGQARRVDSRLTFREAGLRLHAVPQLLVAERLGHAAGAVAVVVLVAAGLHGVHHVGHRVAAGHILERLHGPAVEGSGKVIAAAVGRGRSGADAGCWTRRLGTWNPSTRRILQALSHPCQQVRYRSEAVQKLLVISIVLETPVGAELLLKLRLLRLQIRLLAF
jgi:hypothetical protein